MSPDKIGMVKFQGTSTTYEARVWSIDSYSPPYPPYEPALRVQVDSLQTGHVPLLESFWPVSKSEYTNVADGEHGIGGDTSVIWFCTLDTYDTEPAAYELDPSDFSVVQQGPPAGINMRGIGGDSSTVWSCNDESYNNKVAEQSSTDLSVIRTAASPEIGPSGIGGTSSVIWHCNIDNGGTADDNVYELSPSDFSVVRVANSPDADPTGIGGTGNSIWHCDFTRQIYELDPSDFSVVKSRETMSTAPSGVGGDDDTIWHVDRSSHVFYELFAEWEILELRLSAAKLLDITT